MNSVWILVCDSARGRLFETQNGAPPWTLLETLAHDESRSKGSELVSDRAGSRSSEGASAHHNALAPASDPKEVTKGHFAHSLVKMLDQAVRSGRFAKWVLIAPPRFVGLIKRELTPELEKHLMATVDKDLTDLEARVLAVRLQEVARIPLNERDAVRETRKHPH
jgi:protein required for attachment to host cells